jgi:HK97 family phage prohead protease
MENLKRNIDTELRKIDEDSRTIEFVISTEKKDAHGTIIPNSAWDLERYNKNGIVLYQHSMHTSETDDVIGKATVRAEEGKLIATVEFEPKELNEVADKVFRKIKFGSLKATSVGFIAKSAHWGEKDKSEDEDVLYFDQVELLEFSIVKVPSNPDAVKRFIDENKKPKKNEESKALFDDFDARYIINQ